MGIENPVHLLFIAVIALVVLGPKRLPELAKALGHGIREFREAVGQGAAAPAEPPMQTPPAASAPVDPVAPAPSFHTTAPPAPTGPEIQTSDAAEPPIAEAQDSAADAFGSRG